MAQLKAPDILRPKLWNICSGIPMNGGKVPEFS